MHVLAHNMIYYQLISELPNEVETWQNSNKEDGGP